MNSPEYFIVDEFGVKNANGELTSGILHKVKTALNLSVLNYQYGYIDELKQTISQYSKASDFRTKKYPLVWLVQPFRIKRGTDGWYGTLNGGRIFIITGSLPNKTAEQRMTDSFKAVLYPIYRQLITQISTSIAFNEPYPGKIVHDVMDRYFWGDQQKEMFDDCVDVLDISGIQLKISNNPNCSITSNF